MCALELAKLCIIGMLFFGSIPGIVLLIILMVTGSIKIILNTFFFAILLYAILSWIQAGPTPIGQVLYQLSAPVMRPLRRIIPPISGFDITPIPALIILELLIILL